MEAKLKAEEIGMSEVQNELNKREIYDGVGTLINAVDRALKDRQEVKRLTKLVKKLQREKKEIVRSCEEESYLNLLKEVKQWRDGWMEEE